MRGALEERVAAEGMSARIRFVGRQAPVEPWMAAMDILFLSSLTEGLPNVLIEAQALGVAAATMRVGGAPETVQENITAVVIDNGPIGAIADTLRPLTRDAAMRRRYGEAGMAWTGETFGLDATLDRLHEIYSVD
jgi:glycosyltransferase involved in cell wall biosynthesis